MTTNEINQMLKDAAYWVGYLEKAVKDYAAYDDKTARAGRGNFTRFGRIADIVLSGQDRRNKDGYPWCAMFILAILYEMRAGRQRCNASAGTMPINAEARQWIRDVLNEGREITYFAGCAAWLSAYKRRGLVCSNPAPGDFVVYLKDAVYPGDRGCAYHIGIVESVNVTAGTFTTIEGNTSATGDHVEPNGGAVARKIRKKNSSCVFLQNNFVFLRR
jgi:hypothetical protein